MLRTILSVLGLSLFLGGAAIAATPGSDEWRRCPVGVSRCQITSLPSVVVFDKQTDVELPPFCTCGKKTVVANQGDDPDMGGREGVPPNSVGSGTRFALMLMVGGWGVG